MTDQFEAPDGSEQLDQTPEGDSLATGGGGDVLDEGIVPPDKWSEDMREQLGDHPENDTIDQRLRDEQPEVGLDDDGSSAEFPQGDFLDDGEVGTERSGRLAEPTAAGAPDTEPDLVSEDVGIDGGAAGAEEAAVHVVDERE